MKIALPPFYLLAPCSAILALALVGVFVWDRANRGITHGPAKENRRVVALTFDDGPSPPYTQRVLKILRRHGAKATFFLLGRNVQAHRNTARELIDIASVEGHEIGNHAFSHQNLSELPLSRQQEEIVETENILRDMGVEGPIAFRPPYGHTGWALRSWLQSTGREPVLWSHGSVQDYFRRDPRELAKKWIAAVRPGAILLLHDGDGPRPETLEALDILLKYLAQNQYSTVALRDLW